MRRRFDDSPGRIQYSPQGRDRPPPRDGGGRSFGDDDIMAVRNSNSYVERERDIPQRFNKGEYSDGYNRNSGDGYGRGSAPVQRNDRDMMPSRGEKDEIGYRNPNGYNRHLSPEQNLVLIRQIDRDKPSLGDRRGKDHYDPGEYNRSTLPGPDFCQSPRRDRDMPNRGERDVGYPNPEVYNRSSITGPNVYQSPRRDRDAPYKVSREEKDFSPERSFNAIPRSDRDMPGRGFREENRNFNGYDRYVSPEKDLKMKQGREYNVPPRFYDQGEPQQDGYRSAGFARPVVSPDGKMRNGSLGSGDNGRVVTIYKKTARRVAEEDEDEDDSPLDRCMYCSEVSEFVCGNCEVASYCCSRCQTDDYGKHKLECLLMKEYARKKYGADFYKNGPQSRNSNAGGYPIEDGLQRGSRNERISLRDSPRNEERMEPKNNTRNSDVGFNRRYQSPDRSEGWNNNNGRRSFDGNREDGVNQRFREERKLVDGISDVPPKMYQNMHRQERGDENRGGNYENKRGDYRSNFENRGDGNKGNYGNRGGYENRQDGNKGSYESRQDGNKGGYENRQVGNKGSYESRQDGNKGGYESRQDGNKGGYENKQDGIRSNYGNRPDEKRGGYGNRQDGNKGSYGNRQDGNFRNNTGYGGKRFNNNNREGGRTNYDNNARGPSRAQERIEKLRDAEPSSRSVVNELWDEDDNTENSPRIESVKSDHTPVASTQTCLVKVTSSMDKSLLPVVENLTTTIDDVTITNKKNPNMDEEDGGNTEEVVDNIKEDVANNGEEAEKNIKEEEVKTEIVQDVEEIENIENQDYTKLIKLTTNVPVVVVVTYVDDEKEEIIHSVVRRDSEPIFDFLNNVLRNAEGFPFAENLEVGVVYLSMFLNEWYRAQLISFIDDDIVKVYFIDFGNYEEQSRKLVKKLPDSLKHIQPLSHTVKMSINVGCSVRTLIKPTEYLEEKKCWVVEVLKMYQDDEQECVEMEKETGSKEDKVENTVVEMEEKVIEKESSEECQKEDILNTKNLQYDNWEVNSGKRLLLLDYDGKYSFKFADKKEVSYHVLNQVLRKEMEKHYKESLPYGPSKSELCLIMYKDKVERAQCKNVKDDGTFTLSLLDGSFELVSLSSEFVRKMDVRFLECPAIGVLCHAEALMDKEMNVGFLEYLKKFLTFHVSVLKKVNEGEYHIEIDEVRDYLELEGSPNN